jgi:hypothetical protein
MVSSAGMGPPIKPPQTAKPAAQPGLGQTASNPLAGFGGATNQVKSQIFDGLGFSGFSSPGSSSGTGSNTALRTAIQGFGGSDKDQT